MPALCVAIPLTIGCGFGLLAAPSDPPPACVIAASALLALLAAAAACGLDDGRMCVACVVSGSLLAGVSLGHTSAWHAYRSSLERWFSLDDDSARVSVVVGGVLREDAARTPAGVSLLLDVVRAADASGPALGGVRLNVAGTLASFRIEEWRAGRSVQLTATLRRPVAYRNPGVPDEARALQRRGIALVGSVKSGALVEITSAGSIGQEWASAVRAWIRRTLVESVGGWSRRSAGVAAAIVIGDRTGLDERDEQRLLRAGTYHVIAISGGNIAILTMALLAGLRLLRAPPRVAAGATIPILLLYGQTAGAAASVQRAIAAAILYLCGRLLELRTPPLNVLAVAAVLGLASAPAAVLDPGFILSFGATLGILIVMPRAILWIGKSPSRIVRPAMSLIAATAAVELVLGPLSAALFGRVTCAGFLLNFAAIPLMAVVQMASMAVLAMAPVAPEVARWIGWIAHIAATGLIDSAGLVDVAPWMVRDVPPPSWWLLGGYYLALGGSLWRGRGVRVASAAAAVLAAAIVVGPHVLSRDAVARPPGGHLRVVFLDVGQGDATLIQLPDRRALLVDAGGLASTSVQDPREGPSFDIGERVVSRALRALGVTRLDTFVLTHADPDHIGGAGSVLRAFKPRSVWMGVPVPPHLPLQALESLTAALPAERRTVQAGDHAAFGDVEIVALHPPPPDWERQRVRNDDSVVLVVSYGNVSIVLPGDIGREGELQSLGRLTPAPFTVLKAPHHGSATSSTPEFLSAVRPRVVVFSAGRDNRFNHPAPIVVSRYRALNAAMFSTAEDGAVMLETDGTSVFIRGWTGRTALYQVPGFPGSQVPRF
jgi:competence protein ComEC